MSNIDKQRITAVQVLEELGYTFLGGERKAPPSSVASLLPEADALHGQLVRRADDLAGCTEGSDEEQELESIVNGRNEGRPRRGCGAWRETGRTFLLHPLRAASTSCKPRAEDLGSAWA